MPHSEEERTYRCSTCGGCGFHGNGPIAWACPDCDGEMDDVLSAQDLVLARLDESTSEIMARLAASVAVLRRSREDRRAA